MDPDNLEILVILALSTHIAPHMTAAGGWTVVDGLPSSIKARARVVFLLYPDLSLASRNQTRLICLQLLLVDQSYLAIIHNGMVCGIFHHTRIEGLVHRNQFAATHASHLGRDTCSCNVKSIEDKKVKPAPRVPLSSMVA
jgi:hypothetical protein